MKTLILLLAWFALLVLCWPLALLALVLWPLVWLALLPFRLVGITFSAMFALLHALLTLPARLLGWRPHPVTALERTRVDRPRRTPFNLDRFQGSST